MNKIIILLISVLFFTLACTPKTIPEQIEEARAQSDAQNYDTAIVLLKTLVRDHPNTPEARLLLGKSYMKVGNVGAASKEFERVLETQFMPDDVIPLQLQALKQLLAFDKLIDFSVHESIEVNSSTKIQMHVYKAYALLATGKPAGAQREVVLANELSNESIYSKLGTAYLALGQKNSSLALEIIDQLLVQDATFYEAYLLKGQIALNEQKFDMAIDAFKHYLEYFPFNYDAKLSLATTYIRNSMSNEAESLADELLRYFPNNPLVNQIKGVARFEKEDFESAKLLTEKSIQYGFDVPLNRIIAGASNFKLGSYEQARVHFINASEKLPANHNVHRLLALTQSILGKNAQAAATYSGMEGLIESDFALIAANAYKLSREGNSVAASEVVNTLNGIDTMNPRSVAQLGILKLSLEDMEGIIDLKAALQLDANMPEAKQALITAYLSNDNKQEALDLLNQWRAEKPNDIMVLNFAAAVYRQLGDQANFSEILRQAQALDPTNPQTLMLNAEHHFSQADFVNAFKLFGDVLNQQPGNGTALIKYYLTGEKIDQSSEKLALEMMKLAVERFQESMQLKLIYTTALIMNRDFDAVINILGPIERAQELPKTFWINLGDALFQKGEIAQAISLYSEWSRRADTSEMAFIRLIYIHESLSEYGEAELDAINAMERFPNRGGFRLFQAYFQMRQNKLEESKATIANLNPELQNSPIFKAIEGINLAAAGDFKDAIPKLRVFHQAYQNSLSSETLAYSLLKIGNETEAVNVLSEYLQSKPNDQKIMSFLASIHKKTDSNKAESLYRQLITLNGRNVFALNNLAQLLTEASRFDDALVYAERAYDLEANSAAILDTLGMIYVKRGDLKQGLPYMQAASEAQGYSAEILLNYAEVLLALESYKEAKMVLTQFVSEEPALVNRAELLKARVGF